MSNLKELKIPQWLTARPLENWSIVVGLTVTNKHGKKSFETRIKRMKRKIIGTIEFVAVWSYIIGAVYVIMETR